MKFDNMLIAHRGVHNNIDIPENTLLAFKSAIKNNLAIELDVQLTKDNVLVVFHDDNLERMTKINKNIKDITYDELKDIKLLDTNETIPTFKEVLELVNGKVLLDIEIKTNNKINLTCKKVIKELDEYKHKFIIKSFDPRIVRYFKEYKKEYTKGILIQENLYNSFIGKIIIKYCNPDFLAVSKKYINRNGINKFLKEYPILVYTIKNNDEISKYTNITNGYICNNIPFN